MFSSFTASEGMMLTEENKMGGRASGLFQTEDPKKENKKFK